MPPRVVAADRSPSRWIPTDTSQFFPIASSGLQSLPIQANGSRRWAPEFSPTLTAVDFIPWPP